MVGVDWLWAQTEEVSMEDACCHRIVRAACCEVLARDSVLWTPSGDGVLLPLPVTCDRQYIQEQMQEATAEMYLIYVLCFFNRLSHCRC